MGTPCDICLEELCKGTYDCHCDTCELLSKCPRRLHPTIRITNKCTQTCKHCCYESSPSSNIHMSVTQSEKTAKFLRNNNINYCQIMGGEFFCNPDWFDIMSILVDSVRFTRIVSNGDWAQSDKVREMLITFINSHKDKIKISISNDKWHTNNNVKAADNFLKSTGVSYNIPDINYMTNDSIVPVGRGELIGGGFYNYLGCYCQQPDLKYSFLIDERGNIYKCGMGVLNYATIDEYVDGGFAKRFKEFNKRFYSIFIPSCSHCYRMFSSEKRTISYVCKEV